MPCCFAQREGRMGAVNLTRTQTLRHNEQVCGLGGPPRSDVRMKLRATCVTDPEVVHVLWLLICYLSQLWISQPTAK
jgi:hypothetical protein